MKFPQLHLAGIIQGVSLFQMYSGVDYLIYSDHQLTAVFVLSLLIKKQVKLTFRGRNARLSDHLCNSNSNIYMTNDELTEAKSRLTLSKEMFLRPVRGGGGQDSLHIHDLRVTPIG
jgi:hypothetical protein